MNLAQFERGFCGVKVLFIHSISDIFRKMLSSQSYCQNNPDVLVKKI